MCKGAREDSMNQRYDFIANELKKRNIRLSPRRLRVVAYLCQNLVHPTVDQIYVDLHREFPTLSRTTIYNTLHLLAEAGLVRVLSIDDNETRYDIVTELHGHFRCGECGAIFNFGLNPDALAADGLEGFKVTDKDVYFKGVCPKCLSNINKND
jgi:Fur family peroxide stress response transcriptional regulator